MESIERRLVRLEEWLEAEYERTSCHSDSMTRAKMVNNRRLKGTVAHSPELDTFLDHQKVQWWPVGTTRTFPKLGDPKFYVCQTFVRNMLSKLVMGNVMVNVGKNKQVQLVKVHSRPDHEAFRRMATWQQFPDTAFFDGESRTEAAVTMLGEVTDNMSGDFEDDEVGKLIRNLMRLLHRQMFRTSAMGFLTDGNRFMFVRGFRDVDENLQFELSRMFKGTDGWQV